MKIMNLDLDTNYYEMLLKFVPIEDVVEESDKNLKQNVGNRLLLVTWTDNHEEALMIADTMNNSYTFLWCTPHKSFEHFKKWYIKKEELDEVDVDHLYAIPIPELEPWNPPAGFKLRKSSKSI